MLNLKNDDVWEKILQLPTTGNKIDCTIAMKIWIDRPNVCSKLISCATLYKHKENNELPQNSNLRSPSINGIRKLSQEACFQLLLSFYKKFFDTLYENIDETILCIRKLIPRKPDFYKEHYELIVQNGNSYLFVPLSESGLDFSTKWFQIKYNDIKIENDNSTKGPEIHTLRLFCLAKSYIEKFTKFWMEFCYKEHNKKFNFIKELSRTIFTSGVSVESCAPNLSWMTSNLLPTLCKWATNEGLSRKKDVATSAMKLPDSLSLICRENYATKYNELKNKYGKKMLQIWPEVTDPQKFVYEDVAIATYLLLLWEHEQKVTKSPKLQSFVDLGCGNGLLVYILTCEGHTGKGIDLRRRKIWAVYPSNVVLEESVIDPTSEQEYSGFDWLLGNHSDELTPWLPVMATRLGPDVRYWVLPCCFYDFYGKYGRKSSSVGQYDEYLAYVRDIGVKCGFNVDIDVMRIPSTKRVCQVGMTRSIAITNYLATIKSVDKMLLQHLNNNVESKFTARAKVEKVRNCTRVDREVINEVVKTISTKLLETKNYKSLQKSDGTKFEWNLGGSLLMKEVACLFDDITKRKMKSECGGLKTVLKNNHQIFEVSGDQVKIRDWSVVEPIRSKGGVKRKHNENMRKNVKTKPCWFYFNHPNGCPRSVPDCSYLHDK